MNQPFRPAQSLTEVAAQATLEPLPLGDPRYVDLSAGRDTKELRQLRLHLEDQRGRENRFAKVAFTGHRGSGKSTELLRLEDRLAGRFTSLHLYVDETLLRDLEYTDLLLWLVDSLARKFAEWSMPLDERLVDEVANWFAEIVKEEIKSVKAGTELEATLEGEAKAGLYFASLRVFSRLKSIVTGSIDSRQTIRKKLQPYGQDLINRVNGLLDSAARALEQRGKEPDLLIVQDNLDQLSADAARRLFIENGKLLKELRAHFVFTTPVALAMEPPWDIGRVFDNRFTMPMVKTRRPNGKPFKTGLDALTELVGRRVDLGKIFASMKVVRFLVEMSGGSVRDLLRLLNQAQLLARVDHKSKIDLATAQEAALKLRLDYERALVPGQTYFPLLAKVHQSKKLELPKPSEDPELVDKARDIFNRLLLMGVVFEYNGEELWFDVHPIVRKIGPFKDAVGAS